MKPKILLSTSDNDKKRFYFEAVSQCGGEPFGGYLPMLSGNFDALILCGGSDVHPNRFGEDIDGSREIDLLRDDVEFKLFNAFFAAKKPILGICRGHQLINIALGGRLYQDILEAENHISKHGTAQTHYVISDSGSFLDKLYENEFPVNSSHHQAISTLGKDLRSVATSRDDGYCEAIVHESLPIIGVQWHPERMAFSERRSDTVDGKYIFEYFFSLFK